MTSIHVSVPPNVRGFVAILAKSADSSSRYELAELPDTTLTRYSNANSSIQLALHDAPAPLQGTDSFTAVLGDDAEWNSASWPTGMANAVTLNVALADGRIDIVGSITGLPPVFVYETPHATIVSSALFLFKAVRGLPLAMDPRGIAELFVIGYPVAGRTLWQGISLLPAGHTISRDTTGQIRVAQSWTPSSEPAYPTWESYVDQQMEAFQQSVRGLNVSNSVLSLTAGMDTRTILARLMSEGATIPACTISGPHSRCLDARTAAALCKAYGLQHNVVVLGDAFLRDLPRYITEASRLSGGLSSIDQAHEVYFFEQIRALGTRRISGNLGNQIGRLDVEGISLRLADTSILASGIAQTAETIERTHWLTPATQQPGASFHKVLIQQEYPFSLVGNFGIGHNFTIQQSPYSNRVLIENALRAPTDGRSNTFVATEARWRNLRHRFFGPELHQSFQRQIIRNVGGPVARRPINWGWRAAGGISPLGAYRGMLAFSDAASSRGGAIGKTLNAGLRILGANGIHEIRHPKQWLDTSLRTFVNDTLRSNAVAQSPYLNGDRIVQLLDEHYQRQVPNHGALFAALDIALAQTLAA